MTFEEMEAKTTPEPNTGCWLWTGTVATHNYGRFKRNGKQVSAHRHMLFLVTGLRPEVVMHKCDNPACINPEHLAPGTHVANVADRHRKGRSRNGTSQGSKRPAAKLCEADVVRVREALLAGMSHRKVGKAFGVHHSVVGNIARGNAWRHVS